MFYLKLKTLNVTVRKPEKTVYMHSLIETKSEDTENRNEECSVKGKK
jgi:hypothetical protein